MAISLRQLNRANERLLGISKGGRSTLPTSTRLDPNFAALEEEGRQFDREFSLAQQQFDLQKGLLGSLLGGGLGVGGGGGNIMQPGAPDTPGGGFGGGGGGIGGTLLDQLAGYGQGERARIEQDFTDLGNTAVARLEARGLGGSSLLPAEMLGVEREKQLALGELGDRQIEARIGVQERAQERGIDLISALTGIFGAL